MFITTTLLIFLTLATLPFIARYRKHLKKKIDRRSRETWAIGIFNGYSPIKQFYSANIKNPILCATDVTDIKARFVADPFMIQNQSGYYLFFEVLNDLTNTGEIAYAFSKDLMQWQYRKVVLKERFHLSYPSVFFWEKRYYMIPECFNSGGIQLYQAKSFPDQWLHIKTIIKSSGRYSALVDPSIIHYQSHWYLFSYAPKSKNLHLFSANTLTGPWKEHPKSPIVNNSTHYARPGGKIINNNGELYRYSQDETPFYGTRVWAIRIIELTEKTYKEDLPEIEPIVQPGNEWWNRDGMHTVDIHRNQSGRWIALVDGFTIKPISQ